MAWVSALTIRCVAQARSAGAVVMGVTTVSYTHLDVYKRQNMNRIKTTVVHPAADALCTGAVRVAKVGHGELAVFGIPWLRIRCQLLLPVPHVVAQRRAQTKLVVQANFGNAVNVAQGFLQFKVGVALQAPLKACLLYTSRCV